MSKPVEDLTQVDVERIIFGLNQEAERVRKELYSRARESAEARSTYKGARAKALLAIKATWPASEKMLADALGAKADIEVGTERLAAYIAEALHDATVEEARLLKAQMSSMQSVLADLRPMVSER